MDFPMTATAEDRRNHARPRRPDADTCATRCAIWPPRPGGRARAGARAAERKRTRRWPPWRRRSARAGARFWPPMPRIWPKPGRRARPRHSSTGWRSTTSASPPWRTASTWCAALADPVGTVTERWTRPNGMTIERVRVPLGVIGVIYESRPNVTADAGALCLKAGNAAILRGGSESHRSNRAIHAALVGGPARPPACRRPRSNWCRRATAPRSG